MIARKYICSISGRRLKALRKAAGYTTSQFSLLLGNKSEQQLYRYECGVNKMDIDTLVSYLKVLHVDVASFFEQLDDDFYQKNSGV
ncbi:helix-turn-helix domain-containing protein [Providencia hangzhouensis]|uniref:helix-turn-helix domain-containing protein n=1 Tax=Providencia hangzhouensis TaxID=3031799 RepID=UPI00397C7684